jgi:hypothetical protein
MGLFGKKCPKCDKRNVKTLKRGFFGWMMWYFTHPFWTRPPQPLNVCRECGFDWEDR